MSFLWCFAGSVADILDDFDDDIAAMSDLEELSDEESSPDSTSFEGEFASHLASGIESETDHQESSIHVSYR